MHKIDAVITGIGIVAGNGIGYDNFWRSLESGKDASGKINSFETDRFPVRTAAEIKKFKTKDFFTPKAARNLDRGALFLSAAVKMALEQARLEVNDANTDKIGMCTGTTFSHLFSILEFDREVFKEGINFANPALFPSTVVNAASSQAAILFGIQGFNTTVSTGFTSSLTALSYAIEALETEKAQIILSSGVDALTYSLFFGFYKLGYMAGLKGKAISCPFDKRRNGPLLGEAAAVLSVETLKSAKSRKARIFARVSGLSAYFDAFAMGKIHPQGQGLEKAIIAAMSQAGIGAGEVDYISSCANSSLDLDKVEVRVLQKVFGKALKKIPVSSIKSMLGETFSASAGLQIASCAAAMEKGIIPPTINYREPDADCAIDCVPNKARKKKVKAALVISFGPGGYNSACVLTAYP